MTPSQLDDKMRQCMQTENLSVLDHGKMVAEKAYELINGTNNSSYRLPEWFIKNREAIIASIPNIEHFYTYLWYHDCGKPFCKSDGARKFPDHARMSHDIWRGLNHELAQNDFIANCMLHDMDIHTIKGNEVDEFIKLPEALCLLLAGLAEIHANADMFGGINSDSFKIKYAQIERRGKTICSKLFANK